MMDNIILDSVPFKGSNAAGEVETLEEFLLEVSQHDAKISEMSFQGWTFVDIDFNDPRVVPMWMDIDWKGAVFYGCSFPCSNDEMRHRGARVAPQIDWVPFKVYRSFMYTQDELQELDATIYDFYLNSTSLNAKLAQQIHDHFLQDALFDYLEGKSVVSIMGGHQLKRADPAYRDVALMAHRLAKRGFLVASGGGPGAMEACNLGAYLFGETEDEVDRAISLMAENQSQRVEFEYQDREGPQAVIEKYGKPTFQPSLAIPTYKYGHEPTNMFGTWVCKFFSNAIREDGLLDISNAGIIYTPGSAGTRQEIFQAACGNHYAPDGKEKPTVFYDTAFWAESSIPRVLRSVSEGRPFAEWIIESDDPQEIVDKLVEFRKETGLPVVDHGQLKSKFWIREGLLSGETTVTVEPSCDADDRVARRKARDDRAMRQSINPSDVMNALS